MEKLQTITQDKEFNNTQRVSIYHNGDNLMEHSGRTLKVDGLLLYKQYRFYTYGEKNMLKFVQRSGFSSVADFFNHYHELTDGENFHGVIHFKDGFRWFQTLDDEIHQLKETVRNLMGVLDTPIARRKLDDDFANEVREQSRKVIEKYLWK